MTVSRPSYEVLQQRVRELEAELCEQTNRSDSPSVEKVYLDRLFDTAPEAIAMSGPDHTLIKINNEFTRLFGYTAEEAVGRSIDELVAPDNYQPEAVGMTRQLDSGGDIVFLETRRQRKDGTLVDVSILAKPIATEKDEPAVYVIYRDISKRKRTQEALKSSEERHRTVLETVPDPVIVRDMTAAPRPEK